MLTSTAHSPATHIRSPPLLSTVASGNPWLMLQHLCLWNLRHGHVTIDLNNLTLHAPYDNLDDIVIGDGTGLHITNSGLTSLSTPSHSFTLQNGLCIPHMKRNLISISQFCKTTKISVEFLPSSFRVKDLQMGTILRYFTVALKTTFMSG